MAMPTGSMVAIALFYLLKVLQCKSHYRLPNLPQVLRRLQTFEENTGTFGLQKKYNDCGYNQYYRYQSSLPQSLYFFRVVILKPKKPLTQTLSINSIAGIEKTVIFKKQFFDKSPGFFGEGIGLKVEVRGKAEHITPRLG